jgi:hypothetical protein
VQLAGTGVRNTAGAVANRLAVARARARDTETVAELEEVVSELLVDKENSPGSRGASRRTRRTADQS